MTEPSMHAQVVKTCQDRSGRKNDGGEATCWGGYLLVLFQIIKGVNAWFGL